MNKRTMKMKMKTLEAVNNEANKCYEKETSNVK